MPAAATLVLIGAIMDESRLIELARAVKSGVVSQKPCLVYSLCGIGIADASNVYTIHDGQTSSGDQIMTLVAGTYSSDFRLFASPLYFSKGLYVEFVTNGEEVSIQLMQLAR